MHATSATHASIAFAVFSRSAFASSLTCTCMRRTGSQQCDWVAEFFLDEDMTHLVLDQLSGVALVNVLVVSLQVLVQAADLVLQAFDDTSQMRDLDRTDLEASDQRSCASRDI